MSVPNTFLVLAFDHPLRAVESVAERMAAGLCALGLHAVVASLPRDAERLAQVPPAEVCGVLSLGPLPLATRLQDKALWEHFECPVSVYLLDAILYDLARVPVMRSFLAAAARDPRLGLVSPESGYRAWLGESLGVNWRVLPFAAFPRILPGGQAPAPAQARIAVIGTIGGELGGTPVGEKLPGLLQRVAGRIARTERLDALVDALRAPDAEAMPALTTTRVLEWSAERALEREPLAALIAIDSWVKRQRRIEAVRSLAGMPVDFFGSGWTEVLGPVDGFQQVGRVHHDDIALVMSHYRAVLNFDPNWQGGVHDRVLTAAAMGVPVLTNTNDGLDAAALPPELVHTYNANRPALAEQVAASGLLEQGGTAPRFNSPRADVLERHNWGSRMAHWLAAAPRAESTPDAVQDGTRHSARTAAVF